MKPQKAMVRKAVVSVFVALYAALGDAIYPYLDEVHQVQVRIYIYIYNTRVCIARLFHVFCL